MENEDIKDSNIMDYGGSNPRYARLYNSKRWQAKAITGENYLEILIQPFGRTITAIATQGYHFVTIYTLTYSYDGADWYDYIVDGKIKVCPHLTDLSRLVIQIEEI